MKGVDSHSLVSVVIPTYYRNDTLESAIDSVLDQTYRAVEVVVVDDSDDRNAQHIVDGYDGRVQYVFQRAHHPERLDGVREVAAVRDTGIEHASGSYIRFLDDDDTLRSDAIERQMEVLNSSSDIGVVYCGIRTEDGLQRLPDSEARGDILKRALQFQINPCLAATMLFERSLFDQIPKMRDLPHDDASLRIELAQITEFDFVDEPLLERGASDDSLTGSKASFRGQRETIERYRDIYAEFPPDVRQTALAQLHLQEGILHLSQKTWSFKAIKAFGRANYHSPQLCAPFAGAFVGSLLGQLSWSVCAHLYTTMIAGNRRRGNVGQIP